MGNLHRSKHNVARVVYLFSSVCVRVCVVLWYFFLEGGGVVSFCVLYPVLPVYLNCPNIIVLSIFPNIYLLTVAIALAVLQWTASDYPQLEKICQCKCIYNFILVCGSASITTQQEDIRVIKSMQALYNTTLTNHVVTKVNIYSTP